MFKSSTIRMCQQVHHHYREKSSYGKISYFLSDLLEWDESSTLEEYYIIIFGKEYHRFGETWKRTCQYNIHRLIAM